MLEINRNPTARELRQFAGLWFPAFWGVVGYLIWAKAGLPRVAIVLWVLAFLLGGVGLLRPAWMRPLFVGMTLAGYPIGWVVSHLLLGVVYYLVLTPVGLVMRLAGRDPLQRRFDPAARTYWIRRGGSRDPERYFRQF